MAFGALLPALHNEVNTMNDTTRTPAISAAIEGNILTLTFGNGEAALVLDRAKMTDDIRHTAMMHGFKQKLVDAAAISRNPDTGRSATIDDKYNAVREVYERLMAGQWNKARGDGTGTGAGGLLFRSLCQLYSDKTVDAIRTFLDKKTPTEKAALRAVPAVAQIIESIRNREGSPVDADALLDELNG